MKLSQEEEEGVEQMSLAGWDPKVVWAGKVAEQAADVQPNHIGEVASWLLA